MNNAGINLHENYSNFANLYIFNLSDIGDFELKCIKLRIFFILH